MGREDESGRMRTMLVIALSSIVVGGTADLVLDAPESWLSFHVFFEALLIAGAVTMATVLWLGWWRSARAENELRRSLAARQSERDHWRASAERALAGFGQAIDEQFRSWGLTPAEREVALLVVKGLGHKEIAAQMGRSERTIRQHASAVYEKAGLAGRAELAAYFLRDVMLPSDASGETLQLVRRD